MMTEKQQQAAAAEAEAQHWHEAYDDLRSRALKAYNAQADEIADLKRQLQEKQ